MNTEHKNWLWGNGFVAEEGWENKLWVRQEGNLEFFVGLKGDVWCAYLYVDDGEPFVEGRGDSPEVATEELFMNFKAKVLGPGHVLKETEEARAEAFAAGVVVGETNAMVEAMAARHSDDSDDSEDYS